MFNGVSLVLSAFSLLSVLVFAFLLIPRTDGSPHVFHFLTAVFSVVFLCLAASSVQNFRHESMGMIATTIQIAVYVVALFTIPIAVWGIYLLVKSEKRKGTTTNVCSDSA